MDPEYYFKKTNARPDYEMEPTITINDEPIPKNAIIKVIKDEKPIKKKRTKKPRQPVVITVETDKYLIFS